MGAENRFEYLAGNGKDWKPGKRTFQDRLHQLYDQPTNSKTPPKVDDFGRVNATEDEIRAVLRGRGE